MHPTLDNATERTLPAASLPRNPPQSLKSFRTSRLSLSLIAAGTAFFRCLVAARAVVGYEESAIFSFDTRESVTLTVAESPIFAFDTRLIDGVSGTGTSGTFVLDTRNGTPMGLTIVGPASITGGSTADYRVAYGATNGVNDVTAQCSFDFPNGGPPWASIGGDTVFVNRNAPVGILTLRATWNSNAGQMLSAPCTVAIRKTLLSGMSAAAQRTGGNNFTLTLNGTATGGLPPYTYRWDTDGNGTYGDKIGATATFQFSSDGGTRPLGLEVIDGNGARAYTKRVVTVDKAPVVNESERTKPAGDVAAGSVIDTTGHAFAFDPAFTSNGFVLVTHGLHSNGQEFWIRDMVDRLQTRLSAKGNRPNVAIFDWREGADPGGEVNPQALKALEILSAINSASGLWNAGKVGVEALAKEALKEAATEILSTETEEHLGFPLDARALALAGDYLVDLAYIRPIARAHGQILAAWMWNQANAGLINPDKPVHLIGHSAGGFLVGECALWLRAHPLPNGKRVWVDRVTMLDTPFPVAAHLNVLPNPLYVERIIGSFYGGLEWDSFFIYPTAYQSLSSLGTFASLRFGFGETGHGLAHRWYRRTIEPRPITDDKGGPSGAGMDSYGVPGFALSPFMDGPKVPRGNGFFAMASASALHIEALTGDLLNGFSTFGQVAQNSGVYTLTEQANSGITKQMVLPIGAEALNFRFRFTGAGDGDFLEVRFGDGRTLYLGMDTVLSRDGFTDVEVPLNALDGVADLLAITLVSRGSPNAVVEVSEIRLTVNDDPDGDGLTTAQEQSIGSNPLLADTDGDGITDGEEYFTTLTSPLLADTDRDGLSDGAESHAGTDPLNSTSTFSIHDIVANPGGGITLKWSAQAGKKYRVLRSTTPNFAEFSVIANGVTGTSPLTTFNDSSVDPAIIPVAFYRVQVESSP